MIDYGTPSYRFQAMQEIIRLLREALVFRPQPGDSVSPIPPENITFRKVSVRNRPQNEGFQLTQAFPGMILSTPYAEPFDPSLGEVAHDVARYQFLLQIVDSDNYEPEASVATYWKWQEQVWRYFNFNCLGNIDAAKVLSTTRLVDVVDETRWLRDENFVCGIQIQVEVWMTRGAT